MARRGEYTFKQVGGPLFERTVGDVTVRLIAEADMAAEDPAQTLRLRSGRVLNRGEGVELISNGITFTGDNVDGMLSVYPEILKTVAQFKDRLPKRARSTQSRPAAASAIENELAKQFQPVTIQTGVGPMPTAPVANRKAKRSF